MSLAFYAGRPCSAEGYGRSRTCRDVRSPVRSTLTTNRNTPTNEPRVTHLELAPRGKAGRGLRPR